MRIETELIAIYTKYGVVYINPNQIVEAVPFTDESLYIYMVDGREIETKNMLFGTDDRRKLFLN